jgi:hypothetical protein
MGNLDTITFNTLSRDEFADAIAKGLGRAFLYAKNQGLDRVKDLVLNACLNDLSYDPQCSESRSKWLFTMFADSRQYIELRDEILAALFIDSESSECPYQLCEIAREMSLTGDKVALERLSDRVYKFASQPNSDDWYGANELIEIQGVDAAIELSRIFGRRLLANPDDSVPDVLDLDFFKDISEEKIAIFERHAAIEESIAVYYKYILDSKISLDLRRSERALQPKKRITLEDIIDLARRKKHEYPSVYLRFGQKATADELEIIFSLLIHETDEDICVRLLWVFRRAPIPRFVERLFEWSDSKNHLLKVSAIEALSQKSDDRVYQLGRSKLDNCQFTDLDIDTLNLFINNYHSGDAELILNRLNAVEIDREDLHSIGFILVDMSKRQVNSELLILLEWIYERTPCSICREQVFKQLEIYGQLSDKLLAEYQFDSRQFRKVH